MNKHLLDELIERNVTLINVEKILIDDIEYEVENYFMDPLKLIEKNPNNKIYMMVNHKTGLPWFNSINYIRAIII
jgi:hypothetical protein